MNIKTDNSAFGGHNDVFTAWIVDTCPVWLGVVTRFRNGNVQVHHDADADVNNYHSTAFR